jgi:hypothetical protein
LKSPILNSPVRASSSRLGTARSGRDQANATVQAQVKVRIAQHLGRSGCVLRSRLGEARYLSIACDENVQFALVCATGIPGERFGNFEFEVQNCSSVPAPIVNSSLVNRTEPVAIKRTKSLGRRFNEP